MAIDPDINMIYENLSLIWAKMACPQKLIMHTSHVFKLYGYNVKCSGSSILHQFNNSGVMDVLNIAPPINNNNLKPFENPNF